MTITRDVLSKYAGRARVFVETGTHIGKTTKIAASLGFDRVYTIELAEHFYKAAERMFSGTPNVRCIFGDSTEKLGEILEELNETAVFWLDGHWSQGDTACGDKAVPLYEELRVIGEHHIKNHIILVDDLRLMGNPDEPIKDWQSISLDSVKERCLQINPEYKFSFENGHVPNDILVAQI